MNTLLRLLKAAWPSMPSQSQLDDAYLAQSVDIYDLERRMREIDERVRRPVGGPAHRPSYSH